MTKMENNIANKSFLLIKTILTLSLVLFISSCNQNRKNTLTITEIGIEGLVEIDMTITQLADSGIEYTDIKFPYLRPGHTKYDVQDLGFSFETKKDKIIMIWFYAEKNDDFTIILPKVRKMKKLFQITGNEIVDNFGPVKKFLNKNAPKDIKEAYWLKHQPFGIKDNCINYPESPFLFGLNWDDTLSYITVTKEKPDSKSQRK